MSHLSPAELCHLLQAHTRIYPTDEPWDQSPVALDTRLRFVEMGVIYQAADGFYRTTEIGSSWVERILDTPDPVEFCRMFTPPRPRVEGRKLHPPDLPPKPQPPLTTEGE